MTTKANSIQIGGAHYGGGDLQHWDIVGPCFDGRYLEGNITKYVSRWRQKNGIKDLEKAAHYLQKLMEQARNGFAAPIGVRRNESTLALFCTKTYFNSEERVLFTVLSGWRTLADLARCLEIVRGLINAEAARERSLDATKAGALALPEGPCEPDARYVDQG